MIDYFNSDTPSVLFQWKVSLSSTNQNQEWAGLSNMNDGRGGANSRLVCVASSDLFSVQTILRCFSARLVFAFPCQQGDPHTWVHSHYNLLFEVRLLSVSGQCLDAGPEIHLGMGVVMEMQIAAADSVTEKNRRMESASNRCTKCAGFIWVSNGAVHHGGFKYRVK